MMMSISVCSICPSSMPWHKVAEGATKFFLASLGFSVYGSNATFSSQPGLHFRQKHKSCP